MINRITEHEVCECLIRMLQMLDVKRDVGRYKHFVSNYDMVKLWHAVGLETKDEK
ncbi:hypothetical protein KAR91_24245 [Candidatus Pacearchaeota archaeon]|nr:hypothetical protein [Candidatus Pacearchaeota archaeon]